MTPKPKLDDLDPAELVCQVRSLFDSLDLFGVDVKYPIETTRGETTITIYEDGRIVVSRPIRLESITLNIVLDPGVLNPDAEPSK